MDFGRFFIIFSLCSGICPDNLHINYATMLVSYFHIEYNIFSFTRTSKVRNKGPKDIMAVEDMNGEVRFSTCLPYPNNMSR